MISVSHLSKRFRKTTAVNDLTFDVRPGVVTGFLGPNGSGKSTTMRLILGLDFASGGSATVNGQRYRDLVQPLREVGALLDAKAVHPGRSARQHLRALAASNRLATKRVDEVLELTGITSVADKKVGTFSMGMSQRLGIAAALLGDPGILLFDEPVNGLDPEGIRWIRDLFQSLAREGRTVFVSSHLMSEMALTAEQIIVIGRGRLITQGSVDELTAGAKDEVYVRARDARALEDALRAQAVAYRPEGPGFVVESLDAEAIGDLALAAGVALSTLTPQRASLEEVFMELTADSVEYSATASERP
ncbi:MAG: ATP-binding cassette domain-containing protein [Acidobacteriota bacterium]|nr:ATP-binding cassette domain-containing protein [Acidobacteriota bacterium]MDE3043698.1 ATP-binding cassette domain-containing protein [Acidobacteriota bacterium]MDE3107052.1 ATP-binding cassette domain-containing protein [Acidobacteriota bacterium]MDE3223136.1 ATP-binding cassette domain-containing protein [Acidobacteriota bacterium]